MEKLAIGCDHAGFVLKEYLKLELTAGGYDIQDFGTFSEDSIDYPDYAVPVCNAVKDGSARYGILICGTGNGMAMTANRFTGIRAALCWKEELATFARSHNDANIIVFPGRYIEKEEALRSLMSFMKTDFEGGRHIRRIEKMDAVKGCC